MDMESKKTHTHPLTQKEIELLRNNPNVKRVTAYTVCFTEEFRKKVYEEKTAGESIATILRRNGIDPDILGESRVQGLSHTLNKRAKRQEGFTDLRSENYRRPSNAENDTLEKRVRSLENELAYTRQEVEFLKKIQTANSETQKEWESRHRQK